MQKTYVDLRVRDASGRDQFARAVMAGADGWLVEASIEGEPFSCRCSRWQQVERTVLWLQCHALNFPHRPGDDRGNHAEYRALSVA